MVKIKINGKEVEGREFQNMPQALAFAFQNGNCHIAEKVELISSAANTKGGCGGGNGKGYEEIKAQEEESARLAAEEEARLAEEEAARLAAKTEEQNTDTTVAPDETAMGTTDPVTEPKEESATTETVIEATTEPATETTETTTDAEAVKTEA